jgi:D-alanyl-lipoteichoic acid acyltransferase DltB (MBOAT superfamily)
MAEAAAAASDTGRALGGSAVLRKAVLFAELLLLCLVLQQFRIVSPAFTRMFWVVAAGVLLNELVPARWRPALFLGLSLVCTATVLRVLPTVALVAVGLLLLGVCHLPLRLTQRVLILLALGAVLALYRAEADWLPRPPMDYLVALPVLASMFMFRLSIYLYDRENARARLPWIQTLNYLFMLPNVCFPLFPCVDYTTFLRSWRDEQRWRVQQQGVALILEGTLHLLLLRLVELYVVRDPDALVTRVDHLLYVVSAYLLYLRVSGHFHLITGILQLFGYDLPRTNNRYFLASSVADLWRRINIYWMEYMRKMVYYPVLLRLRGRGPVQASIVATLCVFATTVVLHAYQFFWLSGEFRVTLRDLLFWGLLCAWVLFDMYRERRQMQRQRAQAGRAAPAAARFSPSSALRTAGTLAGMTLLWSLWSSESISVARWFEIVSGVVRP